MSVSSIQEKTLIFSCLFQPHTVYQDHSVITAGIVSERKPNFPSKQKNNQQLLTTKIHISCHVVNFIFTPTQSIQNLQYDIFLEYFGP